MTRVSENSSSASLGYALSKAKSKMEDLQLKGSTLKKISRPSDNPLSNIEALSINSSNLDGKQYTRNADYALMNLNIIDKSMEQLTDILSKAKEIAIAQSSDFYSQDIRKNVANEIKQLRRQAISIGNQRVGQKYIFSGYNTLTRPFGEEGKYLGDKGQITVEVAKDFFVPININGYEIFFSAENSDSKDPHPLNKFPDLKTSPMHKALPDEKNQNQILNNENAPKDFSNLRDLASVEYKKEERHNILADLQSLSIALENDQPEMVQNLLEGFDSSISRIISMRTKVGSVMNSVESSKVSVEGQMVDRTARRSKLVDADVAELFSDIAKQQSILKTTYQSSVGNLNLKLIDFLR